MAPSALHPGFVASGFSRGNGSLGLLLRFWTRLLGVSVEEGAATPVWLASAPEVEQVSGAYFVKMKRSEPSTGALDATAAQRLWKMSEEMTGMGGKAV